MQKGKVLIKPSLWKQIQNIFKFYLLALIDFIKHALFIIIYLEVNYKYEPKIEFITKHYFIYNF